MQIVSSGDNLHEMSKPVSRKIRKNILKCRMLECFITKPCLYNTDPLKPHFYIVKLGFTGVYIIFLISAQNIDCRYSLEPPRLGGSNEYPQLCFEQKHEKYQNFYLKIFIFFGSKSFSIFE